MHVEIDISEPLKLGFPLAQANKVPMWVYFKYEILSDYCYACGHLGHARQTCSNPCSPHPINLWTMAIS